MCLLANRICKDRWWRNGIESLECGLDCCEESYSGLGVDGGRAMLERVGATMTILTDWRGGRPHS